MNHGDITLAKSSGYLNRQSLQLKETVEALLANTLEQTTWGHVPKQEILNHLAIAINEDSDVGPLLQLATLYELCDQPEKTKVIVEQLAGVSGRPLSLNEASRLNLLMARLLFHEDLAGADHFAQVAQLISEATADNVELFPVCLMLQAQIALFHGKNSSALELSRQSLACWKDDDRDVVKVEAYLTHTRCLIAMGARDEAQAQLIKALISLEKLPPEHRLFGLALLTQAEMAANEQEYTRSIKLAKASFYALSTSSWQRHSAFANSLIEAIERKMNN